MAQAGCGVFSPEGRKVREAIGGVCDCTSGQAMTRGLAKVGRAVETLSSGLGSGIGLADRPRSRTLGLLNHPAHNLINKISYLIYEDYGRSENPRWFTFTKGEEKERDCDSARLRGFYELIGLSRVISIHPRISTLRIDGFGISAFS